jgi:hypothetical protein
MTAAELNEAMAILWGIGAGGVLTADSLGGTPLNEAIVLATKVVNDFRKKNKLEIVNTIFLTDGESNAIGGLKNETKSVSRNVRRYFYNDPVTGKTYDFTPYGGWGELGIKNTNTLLRILKDNTGSNLIGFYLWNSGWRHFTSRFNIDSGESGFSKDASKFWKDNKFYPVKSHGYDDYYVIDVQALVDETNTLEIDPKKTTRVMAKAFTKFNNKKKVNRVLLRKFIDNVTSQAKKSA